MTLTVDCLKDDELHTVVSWLDLADHAALSSCSRKLFNETNKLQHWERLLRRHVRDYVPLMGKIHAAYEKLKNWHTLKSCTWSSLGSTTILKHRFLHRSAYDPISKTSIVFGGEATGAVTGNGRRSDRHLLNDAFRVAMSEETGIVTFKLLTIAKGSPLPQPTSACASCILRGDMYVFGGIVSGAPSHERSFSNLLWRLENVSEDKDEYTWECVSSTSTFKRRHANLSTDDEPDAMPAGRWGHTMVSLHDKYLFMFGGSAPGESFSDSWIYCPQRQWTRLHVSDRETRGARGAVPHSRAGHAMCVAGNYIYLLGGNDQSVCFEDLWRLSVSEVIAYYERYTAEEIWQKSRTVSLKWERLSNGTSHGGSYGPYGGSYGGPAAAIGKCVVPIGDQIFTFGGRDLHKQKYRRGVHVYDTRKNHWREVFVSVRNSDQETMTPSETCQSIGSASNAIVSENQVSMQIDEQEDVDDSDGDEEWEDVDDDDDDDDDDGDMSDASDVVGAMELDDEDVDQDDQAVVNQAHHVQQMLDDGDEEGLLQEVLNGRIQLHGADIVNAIALLMQRGRAAAARLVAGIGRHLDDDGQGNGELGPNGPQLRTGHSAIPTSTGILFLGGLLPSTLASGEILHLSIFGAYEDDDVDTRTCGVASSEMEMSSGEAVGSDGSQALSLAQIGDDLPAVGAVGARRGAVQLRARRKRARQKTLRLVES